MGEYFWDVVGPLLIIIFIINTLISLYAFKKKSIFIFIINILITVFISFIFIWSIGKFLIIISLFQTVGLLYSVFYSIQNKNNVN